MTVPWILLAMAFLSHVFSLGSLFLYTCHPAPVFLGWIVASLSALAVIPATLIQQGRSPKEHRRGGQATMLYIGGLLLVLFSLLSLLPTLMGFDSC